MYFKINLNKLEDTSLALKKKRAELSLFISLAFLVLLLFSAALYINIRLSRKENAFEKTIHDLKAQIKQLQESEHFISEAEVYSLNRLNSQRVFWTKKLESLANMVGDKISLTEIKYNRGVLYIRGIAKVKRTQNNFNLVSDFLERIKADKNFTRDFRKIDFRSSSRVNFMEQDLLNFEIVMEEEKQENG
jgi:Tfp pilus assembly protein PilN